MQQWEYMTLVIVRTAQGEWGGGPRPVGVIEEFLNDQAFAGWEFVDLAPYSLKQVIVPTGTFFDVIAYRAVFRRRRSRREPSEASSIPPTPSLVPEAAAGG
jgi:hypothetical protein